MNVFDLLLALFAALAATGGHRLGLVARLTAWTGLIVGLLAGARIGAWASSAAGGDDPAKALLIASTALVLGAALGQFAGQTLGLRVRPRRTGRTVQADRLAGAATGVAAVLAGTWLLTPVMRHGDGWMQRLADGSLVVAVIDDVAPDPPDPLVAATRIAGLEQWSELARQFQGGLPGRELADPGPVPPQLDRAVRAATVRVEHAVCRAGMQEGTGFVAAPQLVLTNAHVVAGVPDPGAGVAVFDATGRSHRARVVVFDPVADLAVLRVEDLDAVPLPLGDRVAYDTTGWVYGHPGGNELQVRTFRAGTSIEATVEDIYGRQEVRRPIVPIRADLDHGDSGSALVATDGTVVGVAFAIAPEEESLAVAVTMGPVRDVVAAAEAAGADAPAVGTGDCLPGN